MSENQPTWFIWARTLQQWGIDKGVASVLEAVGSLGILLAQLLYVSQPILSGVVSPHSIGSLAGMLESSAERQEFIMILRKGTASESAG